MVHSLEFFGAARRLDGLLVLFAVILAPIWLWPVASAQQDGGLLGGQPADAVYDVRYLLRQAEQGDARAAFLLGTRFASGRGAARDDSEAFRWFEKAAEAGLAEAQYNLGVMYASGRGVVRNMAAAARWYEQAANQGIAEAQFNIGTLYALGAGVDKDEVRAAEWLRRAANKSLPQAQFNLGVLHEHGRGVRLDARMAMAWYRRAAEQGYEPAKQRLGALEAKFGLVEAAPLSDPSPAMVPAPKDEGRSATEWLAALDPQHYTLQLLSDKDEGSVKRFVTDHLDPGRGGYFSSRIKGDLWYSVIYGVYPDYGSAKLAVEGLPGALRKLKPWIRKVESVQTQMLR
ncbi:MAG: SPOR domain-containing protein [Gammaproteobacteria bacterium]|nr:SPOR domain-containing protein [Gammaproteobacteria bacterium]